MLERALSKILALLVFCMLIVPVLIAAHFAITSYHQKREDLADTRLRLSRLENAAAIIIDPALTDRIAGQFADYKSSSTSRGTLVAGLQERLRELAQQAQVEIIQMSEAPAAEENAPFERLTLRLQVSGLAANLVQFVAAVDSSKPLLLTDNLNLRPSPIVAVTAQTEPPLEAEFEVTGFADKVGATP